MDSSDSTNEKSTFKAGDSSSKAHKCISLLRIHCYECHNDQERESGIRVDHLDGSVPENRIKLWEEIAKQIESGEMPPEDQLQPSEDELREAFAAYGDVSSVKILTDRETGRSRGFGFVEMPNQSEGEAAVAQLNGKEVGGRSLRVNEARPRERR